MVFFVFVVVVEVVPVVSVPVVPMVPIVPEVPEVSVEVIVPIGTVVSIVADVTVVDEADVSVVTVSVLVFSSFLQPNAISATATNAKNVIEKDFFIATLLDSSETTGDYNGEDVNGSRSRGAILET